MNKTKKIKRCNRLLLFTTVAMLASSIQLEATGSRSILWVWLHILAGLLFTGNAIWHIYLHFGWKSWGGKLRKQKSPVTKWLAFGGLLTLLSALAASVHWLSAYTHSPLGGVHGKLGFLFLTLAIGHTLKRIRFFKAQKPRKAVSN